jgi:hypothetical protein
MQSSFLGFLPILIPLLCALALSCDQSQILFVFTLDLKSMYEGEHMIFGLLGLANIDQDDVLQFHHLHINDKISFFFMAG